MSDEHKKNFWLAVILVAVLALLAISGCAKVSVTPPEPRPDAGQSRLLASDYQQAWKRAIGWFDVHEIEIEDIDERNGLIYGIWALPEGSGVLDCGTFHVATALSPPVVEQEAQVRLHMRGALVNRPSVLVAVTGHYRFEVVDHYAAQRIERSGPCVSRGTLEDDIFAFLSG